MKEVKSTWSRERGEPRPRLAESPGSRGSPSNARADWGHAAPHIGKSGSQPASARRDNANVVGGNRTPFDRCGADMADVRHHRAVQVVIVEVQAAGSPLDLLAGRHALVPPRRRHLGDECFRTSVTAPSTLPHQDNGWGVLGNGPGVSPVLGHADRCRWTRI
jgi:hypothetical protein